MQITIFVKNGLEYYKKFHKYLFNNFLKKALIFFSLILFLDIVFIYSGLKEGFDNQTSETNFLENGKRVITYTYNYYYHLPVGIGIALIIVFSLISLMLLNSVRKSKKRFNKLLDKCDGREYIISISINEKTISYKDTGVEMQVLWSEIRKYNIKKDYVLLFSNHLMANFLIIPCNQMSKEEYQNFLFFLNQIKKE